ncbi:helix-turn-helix domain-containing protein [Flagellimonas pacifica]|uniref:helix-turn-helix domain-containing protein n=1 Tax=Flagellimonas pacifica TaxID=1247520 RepID=UPI001A9C5A3B|nr:helix-turn-helix domain-containing protein [Allomuricauda parva]
METNYPELLFATSPLFFFILPLLYIFQNRLNNKKTNWLYHFIIPILIFFMLLPTIRMDSVDKLAMYNREGINDPVWIVLIYFLFATFYAMKTFMVNRQHKVNLLSTLSNNDVELQLFSNKLIYFSSILIIVIPISLSIQYFSFETLIIDKLLFIIFSLIPHFVLFSMLKMRTFSITNELKIQPKQISGINLEKLEVLKSELTTFMVNNQPYLNQYLNLQTLANLISWNRSNLSMVINKGFGKNFYDYINEYRLEVVMEKLKDGAHKEYSLDYIVCESGFKNYVSFYRIFKRIEKKSPQEYLNQLK